MGVLCCGDAENSASPQYEQAAGHSNTMQYSGNKLKKETRITEAQNYELIFDDMTETSLRGLRPFVPHLYAVNETGNPKMKEIVIENLLYGLENGSFIDLKLGTNTLTAGKEKNLVKKKTRDIMDVEVTTSHLLGYTVCGMNLKDPLTGKPRDGGKVKKSQAPKNSAEAELYLENFFKY